MLSEIIKRMKEAAYVREDVIACVLDWITRCEIVCIGAPYEADWQLKQLELDGIIDAELTVDSDLIALGCSTIIYNWNVNSKGGNCNIIRKSKALELLDLSETDFRQLCIFLGTDYTPRASHKKGIIKLLPRHDE